MVIFDEYMIYGIRSLNRVVALDCVLERNFHQPPARESHLGYIPKFTFKNRILKKAIREVNYAPTKGGELVMLPMLPWQAYSTIGRLTDALPSRFSEYRRAAF